jgi:uncharacterized protein YerC
MMSDFTELFALLDPLERARAAEASIREDRARRAELDAIRRDAVIELINQGWTTRRLGAELGLSAARITQIKRSGGLGSTL